MMESASPSIPTEARIPVVGIGASAGGLEVIGELLVALPPRTGMAFLVVQHLDPDRASLLVELLGKKTDMPVAEVVDGMEIEPNHVYIIPPNRHLTLEKNILRLELRPEQRYPSMPVDVLFASIATERQHEAIGIVLSGHGSDGARGVRAIQEAGGITFAQDDVSAAFSGMPRAAVGTGCVDFVLSPSAIAAKLIELREHPYIKQTRAPAPSHEADETAALQIAPSDEDTLKRVFRILRASSGVDFSHYKRSTLERRLARRMAVHHVNTLPGYMEVLLTNPAEPEALAQDFLISVTRFFRDPEGLEGLTQIVFPAIMENRSHKDPVRIWVPGCATGEEAYSIAITIMEFLGQRALTMPVQIFGTDVSETAIERARAGVYVPNVAAEVSPERLARFFVKLDDHYQIAKSVREMCLFAKHNAMRDPPFSRLDLVSCCNLLIYLDQPMQRRLMSVFHYALKPQGYLLLGPSESVGQSEGVFELKDKRRRIYIRKAAPGRPLPYEIEHAVSPRHDARHITAAPALLEAERMQREADRLLLARYAPPSVLVDDNLNVLQFRGRTAPYLEHAPGPASLNLRKLLPPGLLIALGPAMQEARTSDAPVHSGAVQVETPKGARDVRIHVNPFRMPDEEEEMHGYLIAFEEMGLDGRVDGQRSFWSTLLDLALPQRRETTTETAAAGESERLRRELIATQEYLQAAIEEHEASKEELRSAHEEVLSSNEELQSTNEELETAKEELQSANEELVTTNEELRHRNSELAAVNEALLESRDYAEAIIRTAPSPLVVLDGSLHLMQANRAFYEAFALRREESDGRYFYDLGDRQWDAPQLREVLQDVLAKNHHLEGYEVRHTFPKMGEKVMILNARRLPGSKQRPEMILLGIDDVTEHWRAKALELAGLRKDEFLAMLSHEVRTPLAAIGLAIDTLRAVAPANAAANATHEVMKRQMAQLTRLVDDLLDVSRITQGRIVIQKAPVALGDIVERAVESIQPSFKEKQQRFTMMTTPTAIHIEGDEVRLAQVISNVLSNASRFTPNGGQIILTTQVGDKDAIVSVKDNGSGIAPEQLPYVFDMFFQADTSYSRRYSGMGIGLTLARRIVELHGGTIEAHSGGKGRGSEIVVRLPRSDAGPAKHPAAALPADIAHGAAGRRIVIIDDNSDAAAMLEALLRAAGHEVRSAFDGWAGLRLAQEFAPDVVVLDIAMPGMDGYEVMRHVREPGRARPRVIALTGFGTETERDRIQQAGFDGHLVKPVEGRKILDLISSLEL